MKVLVCGSRDWEDDRIIHAFLTGLYAENTVGHMVAEMSEFVVIEGGAKGADRAADWWAGNSPMHSHNEHPDHPVFRHKKFPAGWEQYGRAAGAIRNRQMLVEGKPDVVIAFKDNFNWKLDRGGTEHMVKIAKNAGVPTYVIQRA